MNPLLEQLHDIEGLDSIDWWPPAIGWWVLLATGVIILCALAYSAVKWLMFMRSWKNDTLKKLDFLERKLSDTTTRETVITLSEYLRRIAVKRYSRSECAGLSGETWLKWLARHDPKNFDWAKSGRLLIEAPYAPVSHRIPVDKVKELIHAARDWVL